MKKKIKALLGRIIYATGLDKRLLKQRALIVAFHRVNDDDDAGSIACTSNAFRDYCLFLKRHFDVVPLSELLRRLREKQPIGGLAVITFDDGYEDNMRVAAPILKELGLPATFFVTTGFIGTKIQAFWDVEDNVESRWMSWDDVRALDAAGFSVGSHTENHADLGTVAVPLARHEIEASRERLEREIRGSRPSLFAYPFGGRSNIRREILDLVKAAGFECCLSCCGGLVTEGDDPYCLPREPITTWHESPYQFAFEILRRK